MLNGVLNDTALQNLTRDGWLLFLTRFTRLFAYGAFANVLAEAVATAERNETLHQTIEKMEVLVIAKDQLIVEKDMLAEELSHRIRNNLQLVYGMLLSHLKHDVGKGEKASVNAIVRRVITLSEVYEQLLGTGMGRTIDLGEYLEALCENLLAQETVIDSEVKLICTTEGALVDLDTATAMGMAVAEAVTNSYEHAFANIASLGGWYAYSGGPLSATLGTMWTFETW